LQLRVRRAGGRRGRLHHGHVTLVVHCQQVLVGDGARRDDLGGLQGPRGQEQRAGELVTDGLEGVVGRQLERGELGVEDEAVRPPAHGSVRLSGGQVTFTPAPLRWRARPRASAVATRSTNEIVSSSPRVVITLTTFTRLSAIRPRSSARAPGRFATSTSMREAAWCTPDMVTRASSRSVAVTMPTRRPSSMTGMAPIFRMRIVLAVSSMGSPGCAVSTSRTISELTGSPALTPGGAFGWSAPTKRTSRS